MIPDDPATRRRVLRAFLLLLAIPQLAIGVWALADPQGWFTTFPGGGREWLPLYGPFDEHLVTDVGAYFLALGALLVMAAIWIERRLVIAAAITYLVFAVPHFIYHLGADDRLTSGDQVINGITTGLSVFAAAMLVVLSRELAPAQRPRAPHRREGGIGSGRLNPPPGGLFTRFARRSGRRQGQELAPLNGFLHHRKLLLGYGAFETAVERSHRVDERLKALGEMKAASMVGCEWCMDFGSSKSLASGVPADQLRDLPLYRESEHFDERERLVLDLAAGMSQTPSTVDDALFARLREHFDDAQLVELTNVIALENMRARFNHALGFEEQGFSEGSFCVRPEGRAPAGVGAEGVAAKSSNPG